MTDEEKAAVESQADVYCPVCDRLFKQEDHNNMAYQYMVRHVELQHPDYENIEEWDV